MKINWDHLFTQDSESLPNCPWLDDNQDHTDKETDKTDQEED